MDEPNEKLFRRLNQGLTVIIGGLLLAAGGTAAYLYGPNVLDRGRKLTESFRPHKYEPPKVVFEFKPVIPEGGFPVWNERQWEGISPERMEEINGIMAENAARQAMQDLDRANRHSRGQFP
jgi:hypothetical protein